MSTQNVPDQSKTIDTPVSQEDLAKFAQLQGARLQIAERILELEQEKVRAMRAAANVDSERQKLFEKVLVERGLSPGFPVEIDSKTGQIKPVEGAMEDFVRQQAAKESATIEVAPPIVPPNSVS